ncbi:hypothetical protein J7K55_04775 [Candidatus Aerophobetes bacterium]|nr:hypothetical protein [Candidatus Aerophobetes bacterium]
MGSKRKDEGTTRNSTKKFYPINPSTHLLGIYMVIEGKSPEICLTIF